METVAQKPPVHTRPFSAEHAKAGAPYCCRDGSEATVLKWDGRSERYPLLGVVTDRDELTTWSKDGAHHVDNSSRLDLVMTPLGFIDGKPVFVGDIIKSPDCKPTPAEVWMRFGPGSEWCWPAPAKVYPATAMSEGEIISSYYGGGPVNGHQEETAAFFRIANAALRHAIDAGQVIIKEDHEAALNRLGESLRPVADVMSVDVSRHERDMAIAKAVRDASRETCAHAAPVLPSTTTYGRISGLNLAAIIAEVKP